MTELLILLYPLKHYPSLLQCRIITDLSHTQIFMPNNTTQIHNSAISAGCKRNMQNMSDNASSQKEKTDSYVRSLLETANGIV